MLLTKTAVSPSAAKLYRTLTMLDIEDITLPELASLAKISKSKVRLALLELEQAGILTIREESE